LNGGSCTCDKVSTIKCLCKIGFSGDICQISEACMPDPEAKVEFFLFWIEFFHKFKQLKFFQFYSV